MAEPQSFGETGMTALPIMLGGNVFGWTIDQTESFRVLDAYAAAGGSLIDTAEMYSRWVPGNTGGESEIIIGEWLKQSGKRDQMLIATKGGFRADTPRKITGAYLTQAVEESLKRLGVDVIDIYFVHFDDAGVPQDETLGALDAMVRTGKVRAIGASNYSADRLASALEISDANGLAHFSVIEPLYNLLERKEFGGALQDLAVRNGVAVVPYSGLASGFLTGKYRSQADVAKSRRGAGAIRYLDTAAGRDTLAAMDAVAAETGFNLAAIALAWLRAQPGISAPIASATSVPQVDELMHGLQLTLSADQLSRLDAAGA
ncbi:hypothetical protein FHS31_001291 [Sphingomonas vulcanisoli]|uniref:NADP-dependent oxidoreductase domain-containing protein n=1 Tax=Sphingomonas vulcanisoli TaxID=1658060 RepID=A0ABX0TTS6_9SPHN|nr:aldo/keto reductase [Sphingomonas vulcanisoli]NIJ07695.1 hypothetical protein [Sphingomonas vulcanisoli]